MEEVRQLVQEEGREARNLVAFHVAVDTPATPARVSRKPPRSSAVSMGLAAGQLGGQFGGQLGSAARRGAPRTSRRSASAGRDKRSELRARYWALLFGDLSRAMGEIYNTVEAHENLNECQEVILVLENYTRDFKALGEWFRLKWEYDNTPPPQRPQSLAWEIRKTDFVRPESRRTYSVKSSPSVSGKNSPCLSGHNTPSGKNSPSLTGKASPGSGKISPRVSSGHSSTSPKANIEFFSSKIAASKVTAKPEPNIAKDCLRLSDIKEKDGIILDENNAAKAPSVDQTDDKPEPRLSPIIELGKAKECPNICPKQVIIKSPKHALNISQNNRTDVETTSSASDIITKLNAMETQFLQNHLAENEAKNDNLLNIENEISALCINENSDGKKMDPQSVQVNQDFDNGSDKITTSDEKETSSNASPTKSEDNFADVSNESSSKSNDEKPPNVVEAAKLSKIDETNLSKIDKGEKSEVVMEEVVKERPMTPISGQNDEITDATGTVGNTECNEDIKLKGIENNTVFESKDDSKNEQDKKSELKISNETKSNTRPAYSQAAAKPKPVNIKSEVKTPTKTTPLTRSKTVVEMRSSSAPKTSRQFPKRNQANKCSYPFNLTTGRTSLFDTVPSNTTKSTVPKKTIRNVQLGSGDSKLNSNKVDIKKQPPRPTSLKINEKGDKKENINITLEKIKDCDAYGSSDTIVTQIDISRIESSESLKTLVPEELQMIQDVANSIEVLNVDDNNKSDNEGWLTVKSRRLSRESKKQSKSHWANRFHQPSATTSLPTLNMLESPKQETKSIVDSPKNAKLDRAKSEQPSSIDTKPEKVVKVQDTEKVSTESKSKDTAIIRQKSDVTGLKTRSSRNKAFTKRTAKIQDEDKDEESIELTKNRLHSSLESLTMGLARSQESTGEAFDFDKWKAEFKSTFTFLDDDDQIPNHNELLKAADPSEMSEIAEMTSQIEENEKKISWALDFQSEVDQRKLCEEEEILNRQIMALQQVSDIDMDTETDDTETDAEILCEETSIAHPACASSENLGALAASLEDQYETALAGMSWAERVDTLVVLEALVARDPGRAQQLHEKLSQGLKRRGSFQDALRRLQAKQARAERQRLEYQTERARKIHQLLARVEEVKIAKNQLIEEKRLRMERRMQKATENRDQRLKDIVRKAHDEEEKLREIAFIKQLEAENRRHEFLEQCRSHTTRLRTMRRDRLLKLEQKAAREAAVGARRQALEAARLLHVQSLVERRQERDARRHQLRELRRLQRGHAAREKAEGVKSRLSALAAAAELEADALRCRIRHKQRASQQRLQSHLQAIREKATGPRQPTTSESQDPNTKEERELQEEAERLELERKEREKQKAIKRKARKVKQKLLSTGNEMSVFDENIIFEFATFPSSNKLHKVIHTITNMITPLLQTEDKEDKRDHQNEADDLEKNNKRNKKADKNKLAAINGNEENTEKKKSKKKKNVEEQPKTDNAEYNNNTEAEIIEDQDVKNENSKKKKKRSDKSDRPKLSKTSSVCSSLSDMSKTSGKSEKKTQPTIDMPFLERQLNELQRIIDRFDRMSADKSGPARLQALRAAARVLALAAQQDAQLSCRSITAAVSVAARISACGGAASCLIAGDTAVHLVTLLSDQLDKDLSADLREMELTKQLADCLSVALDSVLCATRLYEEKRTEPGDDLEIITTLRNRAHAIISYLCLCGCISRAEKAGEARESVQTLLTVCADLCHPCDLDVGSERASATQSLRCALGTSVCGSRAEFCVLFAKGAELSQSGGFVRAARTAHLLRALAELDHQIVQEAFGEGGWPLEFRAAVARLLSQHAPNDKEAPRTAALRLCNQRLDQTLSETMVLDLIVLVGFVVVNNPQLQETICDGWSVIKTLCTLPANWLVSKVHSHALLPTLIAVSERPSAASAIASELSMKMLEDYLESPDAQKVKLVQVIKQGRAKKSGKK
ncbi:S phase cyclin A-associated protein in the endoplasmic reticulum [Galleria mellonella]|uniref:S phase cyclin A-associated protein in the endoplasmic reticulum n=1 Tax=Galleria mellonella TaxID=7137 RepID=A0ABM3MDE1_GALME|nr:S phase cyclin A-associated protein in the endoplasmic reticulum [Galleria mellonella]